MVGQLHDMGALFPVKFPAECGGVSTPDRNILPLPRIERRTLSRPACRVLAKQQIAYSFDHQHHLAATATAICGPPVRVAPTCAWIYCDVSLSDREMGYDEHAEYSQHDATFHNLFT